MCVWCVGYSLVCVVWYMCDIILYGYVVFYYGVYGMCVVWCMNNVVSCVQFESVWHYVCLERKVWCV